MNCHITTFTLTVLWSIFALAGIIRVPEDQPGIQEGINAAVNGDTVLVADSTYYENINFMGKAITVASYMLMDNDSTHRDNTIINGGFPANPDSGSVVFFVSGEDTNSVIYGFTITGGTGTLFDNNPLRRIGGGIFCGNSGARILQNKIILNSVTNDMVCNGGGIAHYPRSNRKYVIIENNVIASNTLSSLIGGTNQGSAGGGIFVVLGRIINNKISFNTCSGQTVGIGGGIAVNCDTTYGRTFVRISGNTITNNQAASTNGRVVGGGIDVQHSNVEINSNQISYNEANALNIAGCAIRILRSRELSLVKDNVISHNNFINQPSNCLGGGLSLLVTTGLTVQGNQFINNSAYYGGGVYEQETVGNIISGNKFKDNIASIDGGGIWIFQSSSVFLNNLIVNNHAYSNGGGIYIFWDSQPKIINNTIVADTADFSGGGIYINSDSVNVMNTILWVNSAFDGKQIYMTSLDTHVVYCDIQGSWPGEGNIDANPLLFDSVMTTGDTIFCCLHPNSPCIDAGNPDPNFNDPEDSNNQGSACWPALGTVINDMGAYGGPGVECVVITGIDDSEPVVSLPLQFVLLQNYPNPFNPSTTIEFSLPKSEFVTLKIYNILGEELATLVSEKLTAGRYKYQWNIRGLASGIYFYKLETGKFSQTRKMLLLR